jgi:hypothetical protein
MLPVTTAGQAKSPSCGEERLDPSTQPTQLVAFLLSRHAGPSSNANASRQPSSTSEVLYPSKEEIPSRKGVFSFYLQHTSELRRFFFPLFFWERGRKKKRSSSLFFRENSREKWRRSRAGRVRRKTKMARGVVFDLSKA